VFSKFQASLLLLAFLHLLAYLLLLSFPSVVNIPLVTDSGIPAVVLRPLMFLVSIVLRSVLLLLFFLVLLFRPWGPYWRESVLWLPCPCCHRFWDPCCWLASPDVPFSILLRSVLLLLFFLVLLQRVLMLLVILLLLLSLLFLIKY
jgi:hypothetical protein